MIIWYNINEKDLLHLILGNKIPQSQHAYYSYVTAHPTCTTEIWIIGRNKSDAHYRISGCLYSYSHSYLGNYKNCSRSVLLEREPCRQWLYRAYCKGIIYELTQPDKAQVVVFCILLPTCHFIAMDTVPNDMHVCTEISLSEVVVVIITKVFSTDYSDALNIYLMTGAATLYILVDII